MEVMLGPITKELVSVEPLIDRISELPWEILDNILGRLPIKNVVATTILSRKWNGKWVDVSKLVFDDDPHGSGVIMNSKLFSKLVYHVLLSHRGKIEGFVFSSHSKSEDLFEYNNEYDHWIAFLSRCDIKELTFYLPSESSHYISIPLLSSCKQLRHLCLTNCGFWFENVSLLSTFVSLQLTSCRCSDQELEKIIQSSPNLEKLILENTNFKSLTICAPSLKYLRMEGSFKEVYLEGCTLLDDASFKMSVALNLEDTVQESLIQSPDWLSRMRRLVMNGPFLKFLAKTYN